MVVPALRVRIQPADGVSAPERPERPYVLYWMIAARRSHYNFALDRALAHAERLGKPLLVLEALRTSYPWASDRHHQFILQGMRDNQRAFEQSSVTYLPYVEPEPGHGSGLLRALAMQAAIVVTDDFPCFFLPDMVRAAAQRLDVRLEVVDGNGLLPLRAPERAFERAYDFRRFLQRELPAHLSQFPAREPLKGLELPRASIPAKITRRWFANAPNWLVPSWDLSALPIDHHVGPSSLQGGQKAARAALRRFVQGGLDRYAERTKDALVEASSGLSPYLHFGHISAHEIFRAVTGSDFRPQALPPQGRGQKQGYWGLQAGAEAFLDQLISWRELGYNSCVYRPNYAVFESLPDWAKRTLNEHAADRRPYTYDLQTLEAAETHDPLWNAAQNQLIGEGRVHGYLRMLWGKKVLEWSESPEAALETLMHLNNRYALDGRNPNSYSGVFWCFGRFDRPWGPERPIYGKIRYMSSDNTRKKLKVEGYVARWTPRDQVSFF